jgi:hypothetical protein
LTACLEQLTGGSSSSSTNGAVGKQQSQEGTGAADKRTAATAGNP